jgi:putative transposase
VNARKAQGAGAAPERPVLRGGGIQAEHRSQTLVWTYALARANVNRMPRKPRIEYPGAIYHVMSRANGRGVIFETDVDRQDFVKTLAETCDKAGFEVHAFCLMRNHFHLVVETPNGNLVAGMKWFLSAYTLRFNARHERFGHVFSGRYKALLVDGSSNGYLRRVCEE